MTLIKIWSGTTGSRLLCATAVVFSLLVLGGCGGAETQKPAPPTPQGAIPGGGDKDEYAKKMKEIMSGQGGGTAAGGAGGGAAGAPK
jgi:hypothetical protein